MLTYPAIWSLNADFVPQRTHHSAHPSLVPFQAFETSDGWIVVGCAKEKFWQRLVVAVERPELGDDPRFATFADRGHNAGALLPLLESVFATRTALEWLDILRVAGVPCGPVNSVAEALRDEQTSARDIVVETDHPRFGKVRQVRSPVRVGAELPDYRRAPARGEHRDDILRTMLGYDQTRIDELERGGAFGEAVASSP
jgi:crotonobetainyl-CoA:carnitine CoA-transferase CaiB-like acyl-CoA transferase